MKYFDAHTHVQFVAYDTDREETIARARETGVMMNVVGTQKDTSAAAVALAEKYDHIWASVGLHPIHTSKSYHDEKELSPSFTEASKGKEGGGGFTSRGEAFDRAIYRPMAEHPKVIAIGECGLDYYRLDADTKKKQEETFIAQIELANSVGKPLMLHIRNAYDDALEILKTHAKVQGDVHFFAGDWNVARKFLDLGFTLSFTGVITFTHDYDEVIRNAPLDMLLSETDAPYITPIPHRGKRNESSYIPLVVERIAAIRGQNPEAVRDQLFTNARRMFAIE